MLRAILTAHISQDDLEVLSLQINGSELEQLEGDDPINRVISGNREIHLATGFYRVGMDRSEKHYISEQKRLFNLLFADLQTKGLSSLPRLADKYFPASAFLLIASAELVLLWRDRQKGAYLLRDKKLFRLQPTQRPLNLWPPEWMPYGDFYAFAPQEGDLLLFLASQFVDRFKAEQLEEIFASKLQLFSMMTELNKLGETYGFNFEQSWLALEIQRIEINQIYRGHAGENLSEEVRRISRDDKFARQIARSKVSRVLHGQELIPAKEHKLPQNPPIQQRNSEVEKPQLGDWQRLREQRMQRPINLIDEESKQRRQATIAAYENRRDPMDSYFERVRDFSFDPYKSRLKQFFHKFFNLWPKQPFASKVFAGSLILLIILLFALLLQLMIKPKEEANFRIQEETEERKEQIVSDVKVEIPQSTDLEINHVVKVNNLQVRQAPDPASALLGSVKRGEALLQIADEQDDWIFVKTKDGIIGYVYAPYLYSKESGASTE